MKFSENKWKYDEIWWKLMKINENKWKLMKINENKMKFDEI